MQKYSFLLINKVFKHGKVIVVLIENDFLITCFTVCEEECQKVLIVFFQTL